MFSPENGVGFSFFLLLHGINNFLIDNTKNNDYACAGHIYK